jgi:uncharacterized protein YhaN
LNPELSPDGALEMISSMKSYRDELDHLEQIGKKIQSLEERQAAYLASVNELLEACDRAPVTREDLKVVLMDLIRECAKSKEAAQKREVLKNEIRAGRESIERLKEEISTLRAEQRDLIRAGGAEDEDAFMSRALIYEERIALKGEMERAADNMRRIMGMEGEIDQVGETLATLDLEELQGQKIQLEVDLENLEAELDDMKREQATLQEQARQLSQDDRLSLLRSEEESLKEELSLLSEEWSVLRLTKALIGSAGSRYEKERQPEVIREAGKFFRNMTLDGYPAIMAPMGENRIEVVCKDESRKEIGQLSRGTAEQLYLSLRFGFIRQFERNSEPLPIIMDEILVNFDPRRARAAAESILALSKEHQILFFTCHPETGLIFRRLDPHLPMLEVSDRKVKVWNGSGVA